MSINTQHRIQVTLNQNSINHVEPNIASHSSQFFKYSDYNPALVFRDLSLYNNIQFPTTDGSMCPA